MDFNYEIFHPHYKGPLEGLLKASRRDDVVLSRVKLTELIDDFSDHLGENPERSVNVLSESLLVFSELVRIKTRELLPREADESEAQHRESEGSSNRKFYRVVSERLKNQARRRAQLYGSTPGSLPDHVQAGTVHYQEVTLFELIEALRDIMVTSRESRVPDLEITSNFETSERMEYILNQLEESSSMEFRDMLSSTPSREEIIVTFLAILQLVKQDDLRLIQSVSDGSIKVVTPDNLQLGDQSL